MFEKNLSAEEKDIYNRFKVFMRFHSKEQHEEFIKNLIEEHRIVQRIQDLQVWFMTHLTYIYFSSVYHSVEVSVRFSSYVTVISYTESFIFFIFGKHTESFISQRIYKYYLVFGVLFQLRTCALTWIPNLQQARAAGCRTAEEANRFIEQKRNKEAEESALRIKESLQAGPSGKGLPKPSLVKGEVDANSPRGLIRGSISPSVKDSTPTTQPIASCLDDWDIAGLIGSELLSETVGSSLLNFNTCMLPSIRI